MIDIEKKWLFPRRPHMNWLAGCLVGWLMNHWLIQWCIHSRRAWNAWCYAMLFWFIYSFIRDSPLLFPSGWMMRFIPSYHCRYSNKHLWTIYAQRRDHDQPHTTRHSNRITQWSWLDESMASHLHPHLHPLLSFVSSWNLSRGLAPFYHCILFCTSCRGYFIISGCRSLDHATDAQGWCIQECPTMAVTNIGQWLARLGNLETCRSRYPMLSRKFLTDVVVVAFPIWISIIAISMVLVICQVLISLERRLNVIITRHNPTAPFRGPPGEKWQCQNCCEASTVIHFSE